MSQLTCLGLVLKDLISKNAWLVSCFLTLQKLFFLTGREVSDSKNKLLLTYLIRLHICIHLVVCGWNVSKMTPAILSDNVWLEIIRNLYLFTVVFLQNTNVNLIPFFLVDITYTLEPNGREFDDWFDYFNSNHVKIKTRSVAYCMVELKSSSYKGEIFI